MRHGPAAPSLRPPPRPRWSIPGEAAGAVGRAPPAGQGWRQPVGTALSGACESSPCGFPFVYVKPPHAEGGACSLLLRRAQIHTVVPHWRGDGSLLICWDVLSGLAGVRCYPYLRSSSCFARGIKRIPDCILQSSKWVLPQEPGFMPLTALDCKATWRIYFCIYSEKG